MSDLLTPREAAERLGVSVKTVRRRISDGILPAVRIGPRLIRIPAAALAEAGRPLTIAKSER